MFKIRFFIIRVLAVLLSSSRLRKLISAAFFRLDVDDQDFSGETWFMGYARKHGVKYCVDVGANVGDWTAAAMRVMGLDVNYYAFEPIPSHLAALKLRFANANVTVIPHAVGQEPGLTKFREDGVFSSVDPVKGTIDVQVVNRILLSSQIPVRGRWLLKIDVEGLDDQVLAEFVAVFDASLALIQIELGPAQRARGISIQRYQALLPGHKAFIVSGYGLLGAGCLTLIEQGNPLLNVAFVPNAWLDQHDQP